ncbi:MAG: pyridoxal-phosphate dependent enzyme [Acidobacteriota bacterium]|nr:MAG: pyridoxal-phosphate dependent enzyme [Acidobacteriota bacterium]
MPALSMALIAEAAGFLEGRIRRTPVEPSPGLSRVLGVPAWLKLESLQITGSFKVRGALFRLSKLSDSERRAGIATCSAGNHGKAVAYAARELGVKATVYLPSNVDESKHRAILGYGAEAVISKFRGYDDTQAWAQEEAASSGRTFVHAYDDDYVMAGNGGSLAAEVLEDAPEARAFVLPVGGGGLSAGFSFYAKEKLRDAVVVGCQHKGSPGLALSLERGEAVTCMPAIETAAGGVEGGLGERTFQILKSRVAGVGLVEEEEIFEGVRWMLDEHQYLIEPSAAVAVAACLKGRVGQLKAPAAVILSGRNVSLETIERVVRRGAFPAGGRGTA